MAITINSILVAFTAMLVYYGFYYVMKPFINNFTSTHSNAFDVVLVYLIPLIIFFVIIVAMFTDPDGQRGYRGY